VSYETLIVIKPLITKDIVDYLRKATIELRKRTLSKGKATKEPAKLSFYSRPNSLAK
jgi:hypothetical protein